MKFSEIREHRFEKSFNGYRTDEVEEFLSEVADEFKRLSDENSELEKKLEVLADKIREYRNDEEALKDALLGAQKQGNLAIAEAKEKAKKLVDDATEERDTILEKLAEDKERLTVENETLIREGKETAEKLINDAKDNAKQIEDDLKLKNDIQREILYRIKSEVDEFKTKLLSGFKRISEEIKELPEKYENDYVKKIVTEQKKLEDAAVLKPVSVEKGGILSKSKSNETLKKIKKAAETETDEDLISDKSSTSKTSPAVNDLDFTLGINLNDSFNKDIDPDAIRGKNKENDSAKIFTIELNDDNDTVFGPDEEEDYVMPKAKKN